jgi:hypothetical protein
MSLHILYPERNPTRNLEDDKFNDAKTKMELTLKNAISELECDIARLNFDLDNLNSSI